MAQCRNVMYPLKLFVFASLFGVITASSPALGQADTALARRVFAEVNQKLASFTQLSIRAVRPEAAYPSEVKAWADSSGVRKLEVNDRDDSGDVVTEYYYAGGVLVFVLETVKGFTDAGKSVVRNENRQYFLDGTMFKWLGGLDKVATPTVGTEFRAAQKQRLASSSFYVKSVTLAMAAKAAKQ